jgi:hypothetical protein
MLMSGSQKIGQKHSIKIADRSVEDVAKFIYLGTTLTEQNCIHEEIKSRLNSGNACYHSVNNLFSNPSLSRKVKIKTFKTIILPVVLHGCETWSVTLREEHKLRVFEDRVLRRIFGPKGDKVTGEWRKLHNGKLHNLYPSPDIIGQIKSRRMRWAGHVSRMVEGTHVYRGLVGNPEGNSFVAVGNTDLCNKVSSYTTDQKAFVAKTCHTCGCSCVAEERQCCQILCSCCSTQNHCLLIIKQFQKTRNARVCALLCGKRSKGRKSWCSTGGNIKVQEEVRRSAHRLRSQPALHGKCVVTSCSCYRTKCS